LGRSADALLAAAIEATPAVVAERKLRRFIVVHLVGSG
jgi:hypothetical protein